MYGCVHSFMHLLRKPQQLTPLRWLVPIVLIAGAAVFGLADPAFAGTDIHAYSGDANPGGQGYFVSYGDAIKACDVQTDGYTAFAGLMMDGHLVGLVEDTTNNGSCVKLDLELPEGKSVKLQVCLHRNDEFKWCGAWKYGTS